MSTTDILVERKKTHGDYRDHAAVTQATMKIFMGAKNWLALSDCQRESLHMFAHKIARILTGNPDIKDHWDDISGYAVLISNQILTQETCRPGTPEDGGHHARESK